MAKFERFTRKKTRTSANTTDERCTLRITIAAWEPGSKGNTTVKGNIHRSMSVRNAKVSEVTKAIEDALFDPDS